MSLTASRPMILSSSASRSKFSSAPSPPPPSASAPPACAARRALAAAGTLSRRSSCPAPPPRGGGARSSASATPTNSASSSGMYRPWPGVHRKCRSPRYLPSQSVVVRALSSRKPHTSLPLAKSAGPTKRQVPSRPEWRSLTRSPTWIAALNLCSVAFSDSSTRSPPPSAAGGFGLSRPTPTHGGLLTGPPRPARPPAAARPPPRPRPPA